MRCGNLDGDDETGAMRAIVGDGDAVGCVERQRDEELVVGLRMTMGESEGMRLQVKVEQVRKQGREMESSGFRLQTR